MTIQRYTITIFDKTSGEIYLELTSKEIDLLSLNPFKGFVDAYMNILRIHPAASLSIMPLRLDYIEGSLFV